MIVLLESIPSTAGVIKILSYLAKRKAWKKMAAVVRKKQRPYGDFIGGVSSDVIYPSGYKKARNPLLIIYGNCGLMLKFGFYYLARQDWMAIGRSFRVGSSLTTWESLF